MAEKPRREDRVEGVGISLTDLGTSTHLWLEADDVVKQRKRRRNKRDKDRGAVADKMPTQGGRGASHCAVGAVDGIVRFPLLYEG
jgi:hypothetical protein